MYSLPSASKMCDAFAAHDEGRSSADAAISADGRIHAAGNGELGAFKELLRSGMFHLVEISGSVRSAEHHYNEDVIDDQLFELRPWPSLFCAAVWLSSGAGARRRPMWRLP